MINRGIDQFKNTMELIHVLAKNQIKEKGKHFSNVLEMVNIYHPDQVLEKGYGIPRINGGLIRDQKLIQNQAFIFDSYKILIILFA